MHDHSIYIYPTGSPRTPGCIDFLYKRLSIQHNSLRVIFLNTCQNAPTTKMPPTKTPPLLPKRPHFLPIRPRFLTENAPHLFIAKTAHLINFFYSSEDTCIMCDVL